MKNYLLIALFSFLLAACTKHSSAPSCSTAPNTITISDNGKTYCIAGSGVLLNPLYAQIIQKNNVSAICYPLPTSTILEVEGDGSAFSIILSEAFGPAGGVGTYSLPPIDSANSAFTERFAGGQAYKISGGTINVTSADSARVQATFVLNLFNTSGSKTITGTVKTTSP